MNAKEIREQRAEVAARIRQLRDLSSTTGHKWTQRDETEWQQLTKRHDDLTRQLTEAGDAAPGVGPGREDYGTERDAGSTGDRWIDRATGREIRTFGSTGGSVASYLAERDGSGGEFRNLRLGAYLRSMVAGPQNEAERRALAEGSDNTGGFTVPTVLSGRIIDALRAQAVTMNAGAQVVPMTSDNLTIAKVATDPAASWRAENDPVSDDDPTFAGVTFEPKWLGVVVKASRELIADSPNIESALEAAFRGALSVELDRAVLLGDDNNGEPTGIVNTANVNTIAHNSVLADYDPLLDAILAVEEDNAAPPNVCITSPRDAVTMAKFKDQQDQPLQRPPMVSDLRFLRTTSIPVNGGDGEDESTIFVGGFDQVLIGMRDNVRIEVLRERYVDNFQYGFLAWLRADVAVAQPKALCTLTGVGRVSS